MARVEVDAHPTRIISMDYRDYIQERIELPPRVPICELVAVMQARPGATDPEDPDRAKAVEWRIVHTCFTPEERNGLGRRWSLNKRLR